MTSKKFISDHLRFTCDVCGEDCVGLAHVCKLGTRCLTHCDVCYKQLFEMVRNDALKERMIVIEKPNDLKDRQFQ